VHCVILFRFEYQLPVIAMQIEANYHDDRVEDLLRKFGLRSISALNRAPDRARVLSAFTEFVGNNLAGLGLCRNASDVCRHVEDLDAYACAPPVQADALLERCTYASDCAAGLRCFVKPLVDGTPRCYPAAEAHAVGDRCTARMEESGTIYQFGRGAWYSSDDDDDQSNDDGAEYVSIDDDDSGDDDDGPTMVEGAYAHDYLNAYDEGCPANHVCGYLNSSASFTTCQPKLALGDVCVQSPGEARLFSAVLDDLTVDSLFDPRCPDPYFCAEGDDAIPRCVARLPKVRDSRPPRFRVSG